MGSLNYTYTSNGNFTVPSATKSIQYIAVGGGGGGARPYEGFGRTPTAGGSTNISTIGLFAGGGGPGQVTYGGYGGYGNWIYGQTGYRSTSFSSRARSGYGPYGSGGAGQFQDAQRPNTYGGGGGGASIATYSRNQNGAIPGQNISFTIGSGGQQGGTGFRRYGESGAVYMFVTTYDRPSASISVSPSSIIRGQTATLTWSAGGDAETFTITSIGTVGRNGSLTVSPTSTIEYVFTVSNPVYSVTARAQLTVYVPPVVNLTVDKSTIIRGESTTLRWSTTGDADTMTVSPGIGNVPINSNSPISPTVTTTYTATASGLGGTGSDELTVTVLQPPSISISGPINVKYGTESVTISIEATNSDGAISLNQTYRYNDNSVSKPTIQIPNSRGDEVNIVYEVPITWDNFGPRSIEMTFTVDGYGTLTASDTIIIPAIIDETPDVIDIPQTEDKVRDEEPIVTPDVEVTSEQIVISDIDIPVEVKADAPIQIEIDNSNVWLNIREL